MTSPAEPPVENSAETSSAGVAASVAVSVPLQELSVALDSSPAGPAVPGPSRQKPLSAGKEKALGVSDQPVEGPAIDNRSRSNTPSVTIGGSRPGSKQASEKRASVPKQKKRKIVDLSAVGQPLKRVKVGAGSGPSGNGVCPTYIFLPFHR